MEPWRNMEKRDNKIFMQSPCRRYCAMQGKLLHRATTRVNGRIGSTLNSKKKGRCIGRERSVESWTYISYHLRSTNFVFRQFIYRRERRADTWPGVSKFSAEVLKTGDWTTSLLAAARTWSQTWTLPPLSSVQNVELETGTRHFHKEMYFLLTINNRKTRFWVIALLQLRVVEVHSIENFFCAGSVVDTFTASFSEKNQNSVMRTVGGICDDSHTAKCLVPIWTIRIGMNSGAGPGRRVKRM